MARVRDIIAHGVFFVKIKSPRTGLTGENCKNAFTFLQKCHIILYNDTKIGGIGMTEKNLSEKITELRKKHGLSQKEFAAKLGINAQTVSRWERGATIPSAESLLAITKHLNAPSDYFFTASETRLPTEAPKGMESLRELYRIGRGPSSSHTMGPERACKLFQRKHPNADRFTAILYGSLAKTGRGHATDTVIQSTLAPTPAEVIFDTATAVPHPNTLDLQAYKGNDLLGTQRFFSVGGGRIATENGTEADAPILYPLTSFSEIAEHCRTKRMRLWQYVEEIEGNEIWEYLAEVWQTMQSAIENGLHADGILPGGLNVQRKARYLHNLQHIDETAETRENRLVCSYAFAVSEENAAGGTIVTAPTCGASGVLPAVLYYQKDKHRFTDRQILEALATAGLIGNLIKTNASISGAECGCQAEVGSACAMASAALAELFNLSFDKIEYAAEIAIEHHLGLTCDPICGLVQIPCIERNAVAAMRAINAVNLSSFLSDTRKISLDNVIVIMKETGWDMSHRYKETSEAGLANIQI